MQIQGGLVRLVNGGDGDRNTVDVKEVASH
jgi:hypothetical protein